MAPATQFCCRFGRKTALLLAMLLHVGCSIGTAFVSSYVVFTVLRFFQGFGNLGCFLIGYVLGMSPLHAYTCGHTYRQARTHTRIHTQPQTHTGAHTHTLSSSSPSLSLLSIWFHLSNIWIILMSSVHPAGHLAWQELWRWTLTRTFQPGLVWFCCLGGMGEGGGGLFQLRLLTSTFLCHFHWPWLRFGVTRSAKKEKPLGFIFSHAFQLIIGKVGLVLKQFKLQFLNLLLIKI